MRQRGLRGAGERRADAGVRRDVASTRRPIATASRGTRYFDLMRGSVSRTWSRGPGIVVLADLKRARGVVKKNAGASLVDLGDGVLCLEFHSKMNSLGDDMVQMVHAGDRRDGARISRRWSSPTRARTSASARI